MKSVKYPNEIKSKLKELYIALQWAYKISIKVFRDEYLHFYHPAFYSSLFPNNKMKQIDVYYTDIREGKFKLKDGIYPIIEITANKTPEETIILYNAKIKEPSMDIAILQEPSMNITILQEPSNEIRIVRILDDGTCKTDFIQGWENLIVAFSQRRPASDLRNSVAFLVVEEGEMRIEILNAMQKKENNGKYYFTPHLFAFGIQLGKIYMLSNMIVKIIEDVLWEDNLVGALKKFANEIFTYDMFEASSNYFNAQRVVMPPKGSISKDDPKINRLSKTIQQNPQNYPLPISPQMSWVKYEDLLFGKYKISVQPFLITQWHFNSNILTPPDKKISYHNCIVLNNEIVIYDIPDVVMNYYYKEYSGKFGGDIDNYWKVGMVFIWPNGTFVLQRLLYRYNIYLQKGENVSYIPNKIFEAIFKEVKKEIENNEEKIKLEAKSNLKEANELKQSMIYELSKWKSKKQMQEEDLQYPRDWEYKKEKHEMIGDYLSFGLWNYKIISNFCSSEWQELEKELKKNGGKEEEPKETSRKTRNKKESISEEQQKRENKEKRVKVKTEDKMTTEEEELGSVDIETKVKSKVQVKLPEDVLEELVDDKPKKKKTTKRKKTKKSKKKKGD